MRKIEQQMNEAIREGRCWQSGNTAVIVHDNGDMVVSLYGRIIADIHRGQVVPHRGTFCYWPTATTRSRLRALGVDACIRNGVAYIDGERA